MGPTYLPIDRPLTDKERQNQLYQKRRLKLKTENLHDNLSVIKLNSTYLETVDRYYADRGGWSFWLLFSEGIIAVFSIAVFISSLFSGNWSFFWGIQIFCIPYYIAVWFIFKPDLFCYTHYSIRFNRKTRKVYAFTRDQKVIVGEWDKMYFTLHYSYLEYAIRGYILNDEEEIVNSFELGILDYSEECVIGYWEFIRRYMEDGAESVSSIVEYCLPIADKKAGWQYEIKYPTGHNLTNTPRYLLYLVSPITLCVTLGRLFAMGTSKTPIWSDEIEQACLIEPNDKVNLTDAINQPWSWKQGWTKNPWWKRMAEPKEYDPFDQNNYCDKR